MASGKSLELREIKKPDPEPICICGDDFSDHFDFTTPLEGGVPQMKEKYKDGRHYQAGTLAGGTLTRNPVRPS